MSEEQEVDNTAEELSADDLAEAQGMGWLDKDQFKGRPEDWVPAAEFLAKGRQILPLVQQHNKTLRGQLGSLTNQLTAQANEMKSMKAALAALEENHEESEAERAETRKAELKAAIAEASRNGDHDRVAELTIEAAELARPAPAKQARDDTPPARSDAPAPEVIAWFEEHQEVVNDPRRVALMRVTADEKRMNGDKRLGKEFLDDCLKEVEATLGGAGRRGGPSRVASDNGGRGRQEPQSNGKSYADLPADAKAACEKMASRVVGQGKKHATIDSWRKSYTKQYFAQE